jgi:DNA (cytosine-5)-methyltransferase 1
MKLGSLFDGSGGFPLAGAIHGITPVWAAEIEPYPIKVTKARFPQMNHLGSVLDVNGAEVEPVDIITFGSPCQDLSVAGKQAGLHKGERSNLFFEAIRIIKEMRESTDGKHPRIAVWENVPGAYSSNKGEDFRAVLQAFCSVKDETADVPRPASGKWNRAGAIVGNGWSIAWRTFDAQFWGVPQRRKRIYLIADFGSERAGEVLFESQGLRGDFAPSGTAGEGTADNAEGSVRGSVFNESGKGYWMPGCGCLRAEGENRPSRPGHIVCSFMGGQGAKARTIAYSEEVSPSIKSVPSGSNTVPDVCYAVRTRNTTANGWGVSEEAYTLDTSEGAVIERMRGFGDYVEDGTFSAIKARDYKDAVDLVRIKTPRRYIIRRLTPLECCRLQGFPDWWEDGVQGSDSARYKMWGNGIALPNAEYVVGCAKRLIQGGNHED